MTEIQHTTFDPFLKEGIPQPFPCVYLIHGQEMLVEKSAEQLIARLLDGESADLCCEKIEGLVENLTDALDRLNTFSLLAGPKIVVFKDARIFEGRSGHQRLVDQTVDAWNSEDEHRAAKHFLKLCAVLEIDVDDALNVAQKHKEMKELIGHVGRDSVDKLARCCASQGWAPPAAGDHVEGLFRALEKGFPQNHYLVVTVHSRVPKNLKLYKAFRGSGVVVDCNVSLGERRSDRQEQEAVLRQTLDEVLGKAKKRLAPSAFQPLIQLTGFDPRVFVQNVEKLIDYIGDRPEITVDDIQAVLKRTKVDPVFELTNAAADRNIVLTLFYLEALLNAKWHPLQILSAVANQMRKLLIAKSFLVSDQGKNWSPGMSYPQFQSAVMPAVKAHDIQMKEQAGAWAQIPSEGAKKGKKTKTKAPDVVLAANPKSPYPVYQTLLKAEKYSLPELVNAMSRLNQTDLRLKSTAQDAAMILKKTLMDICAPTRGRSA